jgi:hypothetical protein
VWWLGPTGGNSGLRAAQVAQRDDQTMAITGLRRTADSYDLCTRLYGYGSGTGGGRLTIATAGDAILAAGYVRDPDGLYLENETATALYGRIDRVEDFPDVTPIDPSVTQTTYAANELLNRMYIILRRTSQLHYSYALEVVPGRYDIWPGQTLRVVYHEWVDGYHAVDIDAELSVLEISQQITADGVRLASMIVSTSSQAPPTDANTLARLINRVRQMRSVDVPSSSFMSSRAGVPVTMQILGGKITAVSRVDPVEDRYHDLQGVLSIKTTNGLVTGIIRDTGSTRGNTWPTTPDP